VVESETKVHLSQPSRAAGRLEYERIRVRWCYSMDAGDLQEGARAITMTPADLTGDCHPIAQRNVA
jgi:hypothetical protein